MALNVTATNAKTPLTVIVVGHAAVEVPDLVEDVAAGLAKGDLEGPQRLRLESGEFLLVRPQAKAWLVGGEAWRLLGKTIVSEVRAAGVAAATIRVGGQEAEVAALVEGLLLADYRLRACRSGEEATAKPLTIRIPNQRAAVYAGVEAATAQNLARELADLPGNHMNPAIFVRRARAACRGLPLKVTVTQGLEALDQAGFPGLVQVGRAGSVPPALVEIRYRPAGKVPGETPHLGLVGKGITFDAGGLSLKPGAGMWEMKGDMGGAAAVLAAMTLIARRAPKVPVTAWCALAENLVDSSAQRPGDTYRTRKGTWVHVDNTDAEGRLVLADVLTYACEQGATHLVDIATLTGACIVALGPAIAGLMSRDEAWSSTLRAVGQEVGEELWPLPLYGEYREQLEHPHADLNNIGSKHGGTITAGLFLGEFVSDDVHWAHLDIAGPAMRAAAEWRYFCKGNTGFGVRTLARLPDRLGL